MKLSTNKGMEEGYLVETIVNNYRHWLLSWFSYGSLLSFDFIFIFIFIFLLAYFIYFCRIAFSPCYYYFRTPPRTIVVFNFYTPPDPSKKHDRRVVFSRLNTFSARIEHVDYNVC